MAQSIVVIYSGGMDSYTLLHHALAGGGRVYALSFDYGQRHNRELDSARAVCERLGIEHRVVDITAVQQLLQGSALTDDISVPEGHYREATMKATVVPNRNMVLLSLAIGYAVSEEADSVWYGAHGGDHAIYPDCRPRFIEAMDHAASLANYHPVRVEAPYMSLSKGEILAEGLAMGLNYAETWTCYNGRERACGRCSACVERLEAFSENGVTDPLMYEEFA